MADTTLTFTPPLPEDLKKLVVTWAKGKPGKEKAVAREQADVAVVERTYASGITRSARYTVAEADQLIAEVDRVQGRRTRRQSPAPAPAPAPAPRTKPAGPAVPSTRTAPRTTPRTAPAPAPSAVPRAPRTSSGTNRTSCARCGGSLKALGPHHLLVAGSLDGFYARGLAGAEITVRTVYEYECSGCHAVESFSTAR